MSTWLVVGLGNPGKEYASTRHNVGYLVLDELAERMSASFGKHRRAHADVADGRISDARVELLRSRTYMNESGGPVKAAADYAKVDIDRIIVVQDELDIPFGAIRIKVGGGDGGHNGVKSIKQSFGSGDFTRVRVGIDHPPGRQDPADYVLRPFRSVDRGDLPNVVARAADAVEAVITDGIAAAQNHYHSEESGQMTLEEFESDIELATRIAQTAGMLILGLRTEFGPIEPGDKDRRKDLKDAADRASHEYIAGELLAARPDDALLSEEGVDNSERDDSGRLWIVDPLDGTAEYGSGLADFAIHVALWERSDAPASNLSLAVVDLPAQGITRSTADDPADVPVFDRGRPVRLVVSRSRPPVIAGLGLARFAEQLADAGVTDHGVEVINVGSVGAKVGEMLCGRADAYVHDSGFYEWDVAAPLAVATHYGLATGHIDGSQVTFNHRPPWVENLVVCVPALAPFLIG